MGVEGTPLSVRGEANAEVLLGGETFRVSVIVVDQLSSDAILGLDFLKDHQCTINIASRELFVNGGELKLPLVSDASGIPFGASTSIMCGNGTSTTLFRDGA